METTLLRHVVLFKFKSGIPEKEVVRVHQKFLNLAQSIPVIQDFEWGINDSPEDFHQGFTHCYTISFLSEKDRDEGYTPHPEHHAFVQALQPVLDKVFVVDYWAQNCRRI